MESRIVVRPAQTIPDMYNMTLDREFLGQLGIVIGGLSPLIFIGMVAAAQEWPRTIEDINKAVAYYAHAQQMAAAKYIESIPLAVEKYRESLLRMLYQR